jgi:hypothetical protein
MHAISKGQCLCTPPEYHGADVAESRALTVEAGSW